MLVVPHRLKPIWKIGSRRTARTIRGNGSIARILSAALRIRRIARLWPPPPTSATVQAGAVPFHGRYGLGPPAEAACANGPPRRRSRSQADPQLGGIPARGWHDRYRSRHRVGRGG